MAVTITTTRSASLSLPVADAIHSRLTKDRSATSQQMAILVRCLRGELPIDTADDMPMSICLHSDPYTDALRCVGWVSVTEWDRHLALQGFVDPEYRNKGLATALTSALLVDGVLNAEVSVAVFADSFVRIAQRLGFQSVNRYRQTDDGWIRSLERLFDATPERSGDQ